MVDEKRLRTGDIITFDVTRKLPKEITFMEKLRGKDDFEEVGGDLPMFAIDIYGVFFVLVCDNTSAKLVPLSQISNSVKHVIRNWNFDEARKEELIGEAITGIHVTSTYPNSVYNVIKSNPVNVPARLVLEIYQLLGVTIPIEIDEVTDLFFFNKVVDFGSGFYFVDMG